MKIIHYCVSFCLLTALLAACTPSVDTVVERPPFFELSAFMDSEIERLQASDTRLRKTINFNGQEEQQTIDEINFRQELEIFRKADINRPDWLEKYQVDSIRESGQLSAIHYQALNEELRVQELKIIYDAEQQVEEIHIDGLASTFLSTSEQELVYRPQTGYEIYTLQENKAAETVEIRIRAEFLE